MNISIDILKEIILQAHKNGWQDGLAGDEVKCIDSQTDEQLIEAVMINTLINLLTRIMDKEYILDWIHEPNESFNEKTPLEIWLRNPSRIEQMVLQIENNVAN